MNSAHLHLLLNHLPVFGTAFGLAVLAFGLWKKNEAIKRLALGTLVIIALTAIPAYLTGEPAEDTIKGLPGVAMSLVERHEEAAGVALGGMLALGALAFVGLLLFRGQRPVATWFGLLTLLAAVVVSGLMAYTANLGGQVHHPEIRPDAPASLPGEPNRG